MPVTAAGTEYTYRIFQTSDGGDAYWYMDDTKTLQPNIPLLFFIHGGGGDATNFQWPAWRLLRDWLMDNGFAVLEGYGAGLSNFGGPAARTAYIECFEYLDAQISVGGVTMLGQSMGGIFSYWAATQGPFSHRVHSVAIHAGTTDLIYRYMDLERNPTPDHMNSIWGVEPVDIRDEVQFAAKTEDYDPMRFPAAVWTGKRVLQMMGNQDTSVRPEPHGLAWVSKYSDYAAHVVVSERDAGHSINNLFMQDIIAFISSAPQPELPPAAWGSAYILEGFYLAGPGDELTRLSAR